MNTAIGEGSKLVELPVQLAEKHPCINQQTNDNVDNKKPEKCRDNLSKSERQADSIPYENVPHITTNDLKALKDNKGKYNTNSEGYEIPACCSHMSPKADKLGENLQYENTHQVAPSYEKVLIDTTVYESYEIPEQFGQKLVKIDCTTNSTTYENLDKATVSDQEVIKDDETDFKRKRIQKSANGSNSCTGPQKRRLSHHKEVGKEKQNTSEEGVYEVPTWGAKNDEMGKHVYSVLF